MICNEGIIMHEFIRTFQFNIAFGVVRTNLNWLFLFLNRETHKKMFQIGIKVL